ncbi:hypothetical protein BS50DRAFT_453004, partial [Corynespora cassiicola Philippines]
AAASTLLGREFPHLIVPVKRTEPDRPFGTQYLGPSSIGAKRLTPSQVYTEISFDVPSNAASWCSLSVFIDPETQAPWTLWGSKPFRFNVSALPPKMSEHKDSWNGRPQPHAWVATVEVGNAAGAAVIDGGTFACAKGQVAQFLLHPATDGDGGLTWFELDRPLHGITYDMY